MTLCVFLGPSLAREAARAIVPEARLLPPAAHGDVLRAVEREGASRIAVIDGYFQHRPSLWHKEILWAIERDVRVAGAASMGALRAAELAGFGMHGVGEVYRGFLAGRLPPFDGLVDDDEVAVVHGPAETGYLPVTVALVDIRATLEAAVREGVIDAAARTRLLARAAARHFTERDYRRLLADGAADGVDRARLAALERWLPEGRVERKRADATALLEWFAAGAELDAPVAAPPPFETTELFHRARRQALAGGGTEGAKESLAPFEEALVDELRLEPALYRRLKLQALVVLGRLVPAAAATSPESTDPHDERALRVAFDELRRRERLFDRVGIERWLEERALAPAELDALVAGEARLEAALARVDDAVLCTALLERLRVDDAYATLRARAEDACRRLGDTTPADSGERSLRWYFERRLGRALPADLERYARSLGLADAAALRRLLARAHHMAREVASMPDGGGRD